MKKITKLFAAVLAFCMFANVLCVSALASDSQQDIIYYEDGSYTVITITYDTTSPTVSRGAVQRTSGTKAYNHYNSSHQLLWAFYVSGTFNYDGRSAEAVEADYSHDIYYSGWSLQSASAYCSGASAIAGGTFSFYGTSYPVSLTLTCSPNGTLS